MNKFQPESPVNNEEMSEEENNQLTQGDLETFELTDDDEYAIAIAIKIARNFLKHRHIKPLQIVGLGNALYALERMPLVTPGSFSEFGIIYRAGTDAFSKMLYINFRVSDSDFEISIGGSVYDSSVGSDSFSEPGWLVDIGGYRKTECDLFNLEEDISEYLSLGAKITVSDESEIDYEDSEED
jgi:hypothetical protein